MKKTATLILLAALPASMMAQSAIDAYSIGQSELRGTARFMSMGGAFTALGGDLSTLTQNPAGIGVYRSSEVGATLDINIQKTRGVADGFGVENRQTKVNCNNFGYVGAISLGSESVMPYFNWGATYSRAVSYNRAYRGSFSSLPTSLSNQVAANTTLAGVYPQKDLTGFFSSYNPYQDSYSPWMSILMYNSFAMSPTDADNGDCTSYRGLFDHGTTTGTGAFTVQEEGYVDEYSINFGGNFVNMVYWGIGFGITDMNYTSRVYYAEALDNALLPNNVTGGPSHGQADIDLDSWKQITGTGFNVKFGLIFRPVNELRIGFAVHTPTWYSLTYKGYASMGYNYPDYGKDYNSWTETDQGYIDEFDWRYRSPWRIMAGIAGVIGGRGIISADYEYRAYNDMKTSDTDGNHYDLINQDIENYYRSTNIVRLGAEYRLTDNFSLRAGYSYESSPVTDNAMDGHEPIYTDGADYTETQPSYAFDRSTQYITAGLGYHYKNFYIDAAYVHRYRKSTFHAFDSYDVNYMEDASVPVAMSATPQADITDHNNSVVISLGFRF